MLDNERGRRTIRRPLFSWPASAVRVNLDGSYATTKCIDLMSGLGETRSMGRTMWQSISCEWAKNPAKAMRDWLLALIPVAALWLAFPGTVTYYVLPTLWIGCVTLWIVRKNLCALREQDLIVRLTFLGFLGLLSLMMGIAAIASSLAWLYQVSKRLPSSDSPSWGYICGIELASFVVMVSSTILGYAKTLSDSRPRATNRAPDGPTKQGP